MSKRPAENGSSLALQKRARVGEDSDEESEYTALTISNNAKGSGLVQYVKRTSSLKAPIMLLSGHAMDVLDLRFDPTGQHLASTSADKTVLLWNTYGDCDNYGLLRPPRPKTVVTSLCWSPILSSRHLFACTTDGTVVTYSTSSGEIVRRHRAAKGVVNSVDCVRGTGRELLLAGGDDGTVRIWDVEAKEAIENIDIGHPITSAKWSLDGQQAFIGGLDNDIHCFDLRKKAVLYSLRGHGNTIAGLSLSPDGHFLLSTAFEDPVRVWDVRSFVPDINPYDATASPRQVRVFSGAPAGYDSVLRKPAWDPNGTRIAVGSADRTVCIWNAETGELTHKMPGHNGTVVAVDFAPDVSEPIIASAGVDKQIYLGEIDPRPR